MGAIRRSQSYDWRILLNPFLFFKNLEIQFLVKIYSIFYNKLYTALTITLSYSLKEDKMGKQKKGFSKIDKEKIFYDAWWTPYANITNADETLALHFGLYEKGVKSHRDAIINRNNFIGRILNLDSSEKNSVFLDSGCGVGGTSIYLAKKYPNITFIGITNSLGQIFLANRFARELNVNSNTDFIVGDYLKIGLTDNCFDGVFAIESFIRAKNKKTFLQEAFRVLKPNKKLAIDDVFLRKKPSNRIIKNLYYEYAITWRIPTLDVIADIKSDLKEAGFKDIRIIDITKNSKLSFLIINIRWLIGSLFSKAKHKEAKTKENKKTLTYSPLLYWIIKFLIPLVLGLGGNLRYMIITAVKK